MRARFFLLFLFLMLVSGLVTVPLVAAKDDASSAQEIAVHDTRTGSAPCGFAVQRDIEGTVSITPRIDDAGNLMLTIDDMQMHGTLTNLDNGKTVDIRWVHQNGTVSVAADGATTDVLLGLEGTLFRGYDTGKSELVLDLPVDGGPVMSFKPGERADDPWAHVCGLLA